MVVVAVLIAAVAFVLCLFVMWVWLLLLWLPLWRWLLWCPKWDKVARLVDGGWTARAACDKIHSIYGTNRPITEILVSMRRDQRERGGHPELKRLIIYSVNV